MAPILSKVAPPPPQSPQEAAALAYRKARPILESFLDIVRETIENGHFVLSESARQLSRLSDQLVTGTMRVLEGYCCMDLKKFARGPEPKLHGSLPILFVLMLLMMLYNAFVLAYMPAAGIPFNSPISLIFHAFIFLVFASFVQSVRTDPGSIPHGRAWRTREAPPPQCKERKHFSNEARWCRKSEAYKPDRAHFCRVLRRPVLRMDHHCPWLGNTIGFSNHKFFYLFLLYTSSACTLLGVSVLELLVKATLPALTTFLLIGAEGLTSLLSVILVPFFIFHTWLLVRNMTTIEFCEMMRSRAGSEEDFTRSNYDMGIFHNICSVLGDNPLLWFAPIGGPSGDGLRFPSCSDAAAAAAAAAAQPAAAAVPASSAAGAAAAASACEAGAAEKSWGAVEVGPEEAASDDPEAAHPAAGEAGQDEGKSQDEGWEEYGGVSEEGSATADDVSSVAAQPAGDGGAASFLVWHSAAEFVDDLRVGCEVIEESIESTVARLASMCIRRPPKANNARSSLPVWRSSSTMRLSRPPARRGGGGDGGGSSASAGSGAEFFSN